MSRSARTSSRRKIDVACRLRISEIVRAAGHGTAETIPMNHGRVPAAAGPDAAARAKPARGIAPATARTTRQRPTASRLVDQARGRAEATASPTGIAVGPESPEASVWRPAREPERVLEARAWLPALV